MINWIHYPKQAVINRYIECYWFIEKKPDANSYAFPKLNPDPSCHLILSPLDQAYRYDIQVDSLSQGGQQTTCDKGLVLQGHGSHWLLPHHHTLELDHTESFVHLGVKFQVGALYSLGLAPELVNSMDQVKPVQFSTLFDPLSQQETTLIELARQQPNTCFEELDSLFKPWLKKAQEDKHSDLVRRCLPLLVDNSVSALGEKLHCSQRRLERSFNRVTGLTLKQCQAMNKLEQLLAFLYQREASDIDWVEVAFEFGFSDQPHLIRHLKQKLGLTPKSYVKERGFTIDVYGGVEST